MAIFDLKPEIVSDFIRLKDTCTYSQIVRQLYRIHGPISPPLMARYFQKAYGIDAMDFLPPLTAWWPDSQTGYSDSDFDRLVSYVFERNKG